MVRACDDCLDEETAYVEIGLDGAWERALDVVADAGYAAKLRTGGLDASLFPSEIQVAAFITACLDREVAFKCTAGLHNAVRHTAADTGFEHHGFLNVLLATRASLDGASQDELAAVLASRDGDALAAQAARTVRGPGRRHAPVVHLVRLVQYRRTPPRPDHAEPAGER